jgi:hypothetical protein
MYVDVSLAPTALGKKSERKRVPGIPVLLSRVKVRTAEDISVTLHSNQTEKNLHPPAGFPNRFLPPVDSGEANV